MDAEPHGHPGAARLPGVEGQVRRQGPALLQPAQRLPPHHQGAARRDY